MTMARWVGDRSSEVAYTRTLNLPTRLLMAGDEAAKVTTGAQHAWGRALVNLSERGEWNPKQMLAQIKLEESKIFKGPAWKGEITDKQVKLAGERQTFKNHSKRITILTSWKVLLGSADSKRNVFYKPYCLMRSLVLHIVLLSRNM